MAEAKRTRGKPPLKEDDVVARLVPDPAAPADVISLTGYLGKSACRGFWRLYHTLDLKDYIEIAEDDIVSSQSLATQLQPLGSTVIWVKSGARLQRTRNESRLPEAEFMRGDITRQFLGRTGTEGLRGRGGDVVLTATTQCCTQSLSCPTRACTGGRWLACANEIE